jgi:hypothetical protein
MFNITVFTRSARAVYWLSRKNWGAAQNHSGPTTSLDVPMLDIHMMAFINLIQDTCTETSHYQILLDCFLTNLEHQFVIKYTNTL